MRVTELTLDQLDEWVARAQGVSVYREGDVLVYVASPRMPPRRWSPTRFWSQGGPLIESARMDLNWDTEGNGRWFASLAPDVLTEGETILEAAMRAIVAARFGEELPGAG